MRTPTAAVRLAASLALALVALPLGCGGAAYSTTFDGPGATDAAPNDDAAPNPTPGDAGPRDSGHDAAPVPHWSPSCPDTLPANGAACFDEDLQCEYGNATWNVACDAVVQCQNGQWWSYSPSYGACTPEPGPNSAACPATLADVPQGQSCSATGLTCTYAQGSCGCQTPIGPIFVGDGGETAYWSCLPDQQGCPFPRARIGSACSAGQEGTSCTYEACSYAQTCTDGMWQGQPEACAAAAQ